MRGRVTVFVITALLVGGAAATQLLSGENAGPSSRQSIVTELRHLHEVRPAAANLELISRVQKLVADAPANAEQASDGNRVQAQLSTDAMLYIQGQLEFQRQFYEGVQRAAQRDFLQGLAVLDGWNRHGRMLECIRNRESHGNYTAVNRRSRAAGAYQFLQGTWNSTAARVGRADLVGVFPADARPFDQDFLAIGLMDEQGTRPWVVGRSCR